MSIRIMRGKNVNYTVPQILSISDTAFEDFNLSFRAAEPLSNVKIVLKGDNEILYQSKSRKIIRPGEMERLEIGNQIYSRIISNGIRTLTVEVQK